MNLNTVFVYGTLRKGGSNDFRMHRADFVGEGKISGSIYKIDWHPHLVYPALICGGENSVIGELYRVSDIVLKELDKFEGINEGYEEPLEYKRVKAIVRLDSGEEETAWVWEWIQSVENALLLEDGDWLFHEPNPS